MYLNRRMGLSFQSRVRSLFDNKTCSVKTREWDETKTKDRSSDEAKKPKN